MSDFGVVERYQAYRTRRFLEQQQRHSTWMPGLRTRPARRTLVALLCTLYTAMIVIAVLTYWEITAAYWAWLGATVLMLVLWTMVQIVSGRQGDAPRDALDEYELQLRNSARSIGLTITQVAAFVPAAVLIFVSSNGDATPELAYMGGLLVVTALLIGGTSPTLMLAWSRPDPDPEDDANS
ncbi:hypothetical protein [Tomitella gaofuii]|uniref:hypothetical protein n=1 Tax=Tomitella gaofuii TaxID=2760083 RepID=UPI0015FA83F5|nr:hypothetical protein [Tomitella gaofuii]